MKRLLVVLVSLLLVVLFTNVALAVQQTVTADLIGLTSGTINAQYEKPLGNKDSLLVSGLISSGAFGVGGGYRKYLGDEKFEGLFAQGTGNLVFGKGATGVLVTGMAGYKLLFGEGFTAEAAIGPKFAMVGAGGIGIGGFGFGYTVALGYTW